MDEFSLIRQALSKCSIPVDTTDLLVGPGDDAAVYRSGDSSSVVSVDSFVEGIHFRFDWMSVEQAGARAIEGAVSDVAAMGASPEFVLLQIGIPMSCDAIPLVEGLYTGVAKACKRTGVQVIGGDTVRLGGALFIGVTAIGGLPAGVSPLTRSGLRPGDLICLSGPVGGAVAGIELLQKGFGEPASCIEAYRSPVSRVDLGSQLCGLATALIDTSDGLSSELHHLASESGCGVVINEREIPVLPEIREAADRCKASLSDWVLHGGEDYELLFGIPQGQKPPLGCRVIGRAVEEPGVRVVEKCGEMRELVAQGYNHFN
jgi:thiamine-monophosphate kinase